MSNFSNQVKELMDGALTIPNILTAIRIVLIPVFFVLYLKGAITAAVIIVILSGLTDFLDGKIARKFNMVSNLGKILDPIADKLTQIALAMVFFFTYHGCDDPILSKASWLFWLFVIKEFVMLAGGFMLLNRNIKPTAAIMYGKVATFAYYLVMILILMFSPFFGVFSKWWTMPSLLIVVMVCISIVLTFVALGAYAPDAIKQIKGSSNED